jgi:bla regulator protein blaR1
MGHRKRRTVGIWRALLLTATGLVLFALPATVGTRTESALEAQTPAAAAPDPTFVVASVKANKSGEGFIRFGLLPGGSFTAQNVPVRELIRFAYGYQNFQVEGGPGWINADRFDVTAKAEGELPQMGPGQIGPVNLMMRALLADRFKLVARNETKEMPIYSLVLARQDRKLGPKIELSTTDCAALFGARRGGAPGPPPGPPAPGERPQCGMFMGFGNIGAGDTTLANLAQMLSVRVNRIVVDKTGLEGKYSFTLEFAPEQLPPAGGPTPPPGAPPLPAFDANAPSLFTALQEQLGLKLESARGPVEMLIIESIEQPTPD